MDGRARAQLRSLRPNNRESLTRPRAVVEVAFHPQAPSDVHEGRQAFDSHLTARAHSWIPSKSTGSQRSFVRQHSHTTVPPPRPARSDGATSRVSLEVRS